MSFKHRNVSDPKADKHYFGSLDGCCTSYTQTKPDEIKPSTISLVLSRTLRGNGHDISTVAQHSVITAYLILDVLDQLPESERPTAPLYALLHDAAEAYTGDIPNPLKTTLADYWFDTTVESALIAVKNYHKSVFKTPMPKSVEREQTHAIKTQIKAQGFNPFEQIERNLDTAIRDVFGLEPPSSDMRKLLKRCDKDSIALEMRDIMTSARVKTFLESGYSFPQPRQDLFMKAHPQSSAETNFKNALSLLQEAAKLSPNAFTQQIPELKEKLLGFAGLSSSKHVATRPDFSSYEKTAQAVAAQLFNQGTKPK